MRRLITIAMTLSLLLGLSTVGHLLAQDAKKEAAPADPKKDEPKTDEVKKDEPKKDEVKKEAAEEPLATIPPEVEAKLAAARRAVAEAIVAAQDAGLVDSSIDPPPILDILLLGRATDRRDLKKAVDSANKEFQVGVSPEVFGAWYTGYGKMEGVDALKNVRIVQPAKGLKAWYDRRATMLNGEIEAVRKARGGAPPEVPKAEAPKPEEPTKDAVKKEQPKADAPK